MLNSSATVLQPSQIVYLACGDRRLYAEVIDIIDSRQMVWVRPLLLVTVSGSNPDTMPTAETPTAETPTAETQECDTVYSLQEDSHLVWPIDLFQTALDTEILPFLPYLATTPKTELIPKAAQEFRNFIRQVWQENIVRI